MLAAIHKGTNVAVTHTLSIHPGLSQSILQNEAWGLSGRQMLAKPCLAVPKWMQYELEPM